MSDEKPLAKQVEEALAGASAGERIEVESEGVRVRARVRRAHPLGVQLDDIEVEVEGVLRPVPEASRRAAQLPQLGEALEVVEVEAQRALVRTHPDQLPEGRFHQIDLAPGRARVTRHRAQAQQPSEAIELTPAQGGRLAEGLSRSLAETAHDWG